MNNPELAQSAAALLRASRTGILSTHSARLAGYPFGSLMPYALDEALRPIFLISGLAVHTKNLTSDPRCSLAIVEPTKDEPSAVAGRLTLVGQAAVIENDGAAAAAYVARHPESAQWIQFGDFALWRLETKAVYYVAGFGAMGWLEPASLSAS